MALLEKDLFTRASQLPGAGLGLYTRIAVSKGTLIVEYKGRITTWKEIKQAKDFNGYVYFISYARVIDARRTRSALARYANDAKGISRIKGLSNNAVYHKSNGRVYIKATRNIPAGGEVLVTYGKEYWEAVRYNIRNGHVKNS